MDIQKEREAFEDWFATRYPNIQKTIDLHNDHESIVFKNNQAEAWQAAEAQAVPRGFVVVNKEDLAKVLNCVSDDWLIETESLEEFKNIESLVQLEIESMIESWSQNDH